MAERNDKAMFGWLDDAISSRPDEQTREADLRTLYTLAVLKSRTQRSLSEADAERLEITETAVWVLAENYGWTGEER